jgi:type IV secretion system protein VirD4
LPAPIINLGQEIGSSGEAHIGDPANGGIRREPELPQHEEIVPEQAKATPEFTFADEDPDDDAVRARALRKQISSLARQAALDPGDGMKLLE